MYKPTLPAKLRFGRKKQETAQGPKKSFAVPVQKLKSFWGGLCSAVKAKLPKAAPAGTGEVPARMSEEPLPGELSPAQAAEPNEMQAEPVDAGGKAGEGSSLPGTEKKKFTFKLPHFSPGEKQPEVLISSKKSIKRNLLLAIGGLAVCISLLCGVASGIMLYRQSTENISTRLDESAVAYCHSIENAIQVYQTRIESLAQNPSITNSALNANQQLVVLNRLAEQNGFETLMVASASGDTTDGQNVKEQEYFQQSTNGRTYISSTIKNDTTGKTTMVVSAKITNGKYIGVLVATLDSATFSTVIDDVTIGQSGYGFILDKTGKIIAHKDRTRVEEGVNFIEKAQEDKSFKSLAVLSESMIAGEAGIKPVRVSGTRQMTAYRPIPGTDGWSIGVTAKSSEMLQGFYTSIFITIIMTLLFAVLSFFLSLRISAPIVTPITRLVRRIELLAEGDLHSEVPQIGTENEIGTLSKSFTETVSILNAYIGDISYILSSLAQGDCTVASDQLYKGDFEQIRESLQQITGNLNAVFGRIKESADQVSAGAGQVSSGSQALAAGAAEQASTVEELSASIAGIARQAEENADSVHKAMGYVAESADGIQNGNLYMQHLSEAMAEITASSEKISSITKVIEDIAFQTNILSLNAAIEAARAGAAGKGFAVVADEVRNLAAKSSDAAKQTAQLIEQSGASISEGEKLAEETAKALSDASRKSSLVKDSIRQIENASTLQARAIEQVTQGLSQVSAVVQTNAATAEESSAASEELAAQSQLLRDEADRFKLAGHAEAPVSPQPQAKPAGHKAGAAKQPEDSSKY